ncbi:ferritin-like domain-containing protein [Pseudomonas indica]|uniref:ferritin-like domain-containing protein n=1 Tax=Pseudomonas indica TaxID=137658 RepID=UPI000BABD46C|nr:PA2169 family four-helix-bundle protein [Pseudomonas indica]MBU3054598.1 PA2169 family four-helix-bundle protein [Pseudomonas indica]PAU62046.1 aldehyde dehydrogenase [Pseudomonas indica]
MDNKDVISVLNDLIETCKDGEKGFRECAEGIKSTQLKSTFSQRALGCAEAARELQEMVRSLGGEPETSSSIAGNLHRRWVDLKSMITGKSDEAILNECERGEDVALKAYREALEKDLPANVRLLVEKQCQGVQRNHDEVKALRNLARAS